MKHFGLVIPEGTNGVTNLTAPIGTSFPDMENAGELFFRTDTNRLYVHGTTVGGSPPEWINLVTSFPLLAPDGSVSAPSYSWEDEPKTGWYKPDVQTVSLSIAGEESLTIVKPGGSPAPNVGSPDELASIGIDFYILNDGDGDTQLRLETDATDKNALLHFITATGTWKITNETTTDSLTFKLDDVETFRLESDGTLSVTGGSPAYETLVTDDDDIPNKKYVDDTVGAAAGADTQIQYNDNGSFGADGNLTWDGLTLTVTNTGSPVGTAISTTGDVDVNSQLRVNSNGSVSTPAVKIGAVGTRGFYINGSNLATNVTVFEQNDGSGAALSSSIASSTATIGAPNGDLQFSGGGSSYNVGRSRIKLENSSTDVTIAGGNTSSSTGGSINITGGTPTAGNNAGGAISIAAGSAYGIAAGGNVTLTPGSGSGGSSDGAIVISQTNAPSVTTNKLYNEGGTLFWDGIDLTIDALSELTDVSLGSPINDGHVLTYDSLEGIWVPEAPGGGVSGEHFVYTATGGQTVFTGVDDNGEPLSYVPGQEMTFLSGVRLRRDGSPSDYTASDGFSIILNTGATAGNTLQVFAYGVSAAEQLFQQSQDRQSYTATAGQTTFAANYTVGFVDVYLNGAKLSDAGSPPDFIATDGNTIVLTTGASAGALVEIIGYTTADASSIATRKNVIINGDMRISQRGTSFTSIISGSYSLDRWNYIKIGTMVHDITQESTSGPNDSFPYWMKLNVTTPDASIAAGDICIVRYNVEGYDYIPLRGQEVTLSFWARDAVTGTHSVGIRSGDSASSYVLEYEIVSADTWEYKTLTFTFAETFGTWNLDNTKGTEILFWLAAGSSSYGTIGAWANSAAAASSNTVNSVGTTSNVFGLTGVQLEIGSSATTFDYRSYAQELELCKRYFQKLINFVGAANSSTSFESYVQFYPEMRAAPTGTPTGVLRLEDVSVTTYTQSTAAATLSGPANDGTKVNLPNFSGLSTGRPYMMIGAGGSSNGNRIHLDAEL